MFSTVISKKIIFGHIVSTQTDLDLLWIYLSTAEIPPDDEENYRYASSDMTEDDYEESEEEQEDPSDYCKGNFNFHLCC